MKPQSLYKNIHNSGSTSSYARFHRAKSDLHAEAERQAIASHKKQNIQFTPRGK